jgi:tRNA pseudouridine55 synthase
MVSIDELNASLEVDRYSLDSFLKPIDCGLADLPGVNLSDDATYYLRLGQAVVVPKAPTSGRVRLYAPNDVFIGVGFIQDDGKVAPKRLMSTAEK